MLPDDARDRIILVAYAVLILFTPVVILTLTLGFLSYTGDLVLGRVTPLEFIEIYIIELIVIGGLGYGIYRLTLWVAEHRLPAVLDALEDRDAVETPDDSEDSDGDKK